MSKGNFHKKIYSIDEFARHYYCEHARLNQLRSDKKQSRMKYRAYQKSAQAKMEGTDG